MPTLRKNEGTISLYLDFPHSEAKHIANGLKTESDFSENNGVISISISSNNFSCLIERSPSLASSAEDLKTVAQDLQTTLAQMQNVTTQLSELTITIDALSTQNPSKPVYRAIGSLLLEVEDRESLKNDLEQSMSAFQEHMDRLSSKEKELREKYDSLVTAYESK